jgi:hypothetical protein
MSLRLRHGRDWGSESIGIPPISEILSSMITPVGQLLLAGFGRQSFHYGDVLQQVLRQTMPLL